VLDTNVLISAVLSRLGSPYVLVQRVLAEARTVFSEPTFEELRSRVYRPKFDRYIRERVLRDLSASAPWVEIDHQGCWSCDPDDDKFIATALQSRGAMLVSGDSDLLTARAPTGLRILTPTQALAEIHSA
jgi:putative PIN family toxin of toxin-antitoxin system